MAGPRGKQTGIKYDSYNIRCRVLVIIGATSLKLLGWRSNRSGLDEWEAVEQYTNNSLSSARSTYDRSSQSEKLKHRDVIVM
jgi:hypothetical protein